MICPICGEPCEIAYDADGVPVYTCINRHKLEEFDMEGAVEEFNEEEVEF